LLVAQGTSTVHYYLYEFGTEEGDTGACIVEIQSDSVEVPPDLKFKEVTNIRTIAPSRISFC
jgi:hypothetical protein